MKSCSGFSGIREHHHVAAVRRHVRPDARVRVRNRRAVAELVDEDVVADHQRRDHRARGDLERLDDERAKEKRDGDGDQDRLDVLAHLALAPLAEVHVDLAVRRDERLDEVVFVEFRDAHRRAKRVERVAQARALLRRELAHDRLLVERVDLLGLVEERGARSK